METQMPRLHAACYRDNWFRLWHPECFLDNQGSLDNDRLTIETIYYTVPPKSVCQECGKPIRSTKAI